MGNGMRVTGREGARPRGNKHNMYNTQIYASLPRITNITIQARS